MVHPPTHTHTLMVYWVIYQAWYKTFRIALVSLSQFLVVPQLCAVSDGLLSVVLYLFPNKCMPTSLPIIMFRPLKCCLLITHCFCHSYRVAFLSHTVSFTHTVLPFKHTVFSSYHILFQHTVSHFHCSITLQEQCHTFPSHIKYTVSYIKHTVSTF